jgi:hypothetical protein
MISDLLTNIDSDPNIIYGKIEKIGYGVCKFDIYNIDIENPMQKFWFYIKKAKITDITDKYITIAFSNNKLIKYINTINTNILNYINKNINKNIKNIERTINISSIPTLRINIEENTCIFNNDGRCSVDKLQNNSDISINFEINHIIVSATNTWIIWNALQIKTIQDIDFSKSFFDEPVMPKNIPMPPPLNIEHNINHKTHHRQHNIMHNETKKEDKNVQMRFAVSQSELLNQIKKLNKTKQENKEEIKLENEITINDMQKTIQEYENNVNSDSDDEYDKKMSMKYNSVISKLNTIFSKKKD